MLENWGFSTGSVERQRAETCFYPRVIVWLMVTCKKYNVAFQKSSDTDYPGIFSPSAVSTCKCCRGNLRAANSWRQTSCAPKCSTWLMRLLLMIRACVCVCHPRPAVCGEDAIKAGRMIASSYDFFSSPSSWKNRAKRRCGHGDVRNTGRWILTVFPWCLKGLDVPEGSSDCPSAPFVHLSLLMNAQASSPTHFRGRGYMPKLLLVDSLL